MAKSMANAPQTVQETVSRNSLAPRLMSGSRTGHTYATRKAVASRSNGTSVRRSQRSTRLIAMAIIIQPTQTVVRHCRTRRHTVPREPRRRVRPQGCPVASRSRGRARPVVRRPGGRGRAAAGHRPSGVRRQAGRAARPRRPAAGRARLVPAQPRTRLRGVRRQVRRHPRGRRRARRLPDRSRCHLPAPDAAADPAPGSQRRRLRRRRLPHGPVRPGRRRRRSATWPPSCASKGSACASTWSSTTPPASTPGRRLREPATPRSATTTSSSPTGTFPTVRAVAARGVPRLRARQLHLGRRPGRLGVDDVQRLPVGPQLGEPRRCSASSPTSCWAGPTSASRCSASTRSRSCGSGWARRARTSPRSTTSPRRCARSPGSPLPRCCSRRRRSSGRPTCRRTSARARTPARSPTSPTTTA